MYTVAKDVKLQIEFNPGKVQAYRLVGYETRLLNKEDFNDDTKDAGEMGAGHTVTAFYEVIPVGVKSNLIGNVDPLKYQDQQGKDQALFGLHPDLLTVKLRYKQPDSDTSKKIEAPLIDNNGDNVSEDFRFAAAVAMFGQIVKDSQYKGNGTCDKAIALAQRGYGSDVHGYRREFVRLMEITKVH
jgi:Ca-activated chloride channel family protein